MEDMSRPCPSCGEPMRKMRGPVNSPFQENAPQWLQCEDDDCDGYEELEDYIVQMPERGDVHNPKRGEP